MITGHPLLNMGLLFLKGTRLSRRERLAFWVCSVLPTLACVIQLFTSGIHFIIPAIIVAALTMSCFIPSEQAERCSRQKQGKSELQMEMLLTQIQPHFLFNALTAICETADTSPECAAARSRRECAGERYQSDDYDLEKSQLRIIYDRGTEK